MDQMLYARFRENVNGLLERRGMSRADLAAEMGVTPGFVTQILNAHREPGLTVIENVAKALGVEATSLFKKIREVA